MINGLDLILDEYDGISDGAYFFYTVGSKFFARKKKKRTEVEEIPANRKES